MSNEYELARDSRQDLIFTKEQLLAPLLPGMEKPPHPMRLGETEQDYYVGALTNPGSAGAERRRRPRGDAGGRHLPEAEQPGTVMILVPRCCRRASDERGGRLLDPGPFAVLGTIGMVWARNAVHAALLLAVTMLCLGVFYIVQAGPFIGLVQVIVYTGAILMLFLFVLMLVGRDASRLADRDAARPAGGRDRPGLGFAALIGYRSGPLHRVDREGLARRPNVDGNVPGIARALFTRYVFALSSHLALLITAALGAMMLAHVDARGQRLTPAGAMQARFGRAATRRRCRDRASSPPPTGRHTGDVAGRHRSRRAAHLADPARRGN